MRISDWSSDVCSSDLRDTSTSRIVTLQNAGAREIAQALQALVPAAGEGAQAPVALVPIDSSNAIALRGAQALVARFVRSEERRVGKDGVSTCRSRRSPHNSQQN